MDRQGRQTAVTNGAEVCTLAYSDLGQLLSESWPAGPLAGLSVTNGWDANTTTRWRNHRQ